MNIQLSDHFTYTKLLRFTAPSICMMIFTSFYSIVDGLFISNYTDVTQFAAINLVWPFIMIFGAIGFMFGSGGSALIAKTLGEGRKFKALRIFSLLIYTAIILGIIIAIGGIWLIKPILEAFGAHGELLAAALKYSRIIIPAIPFFMLQYTFQSLLVTAERPKLGFAVTFISGMTNIVLDALFIVKLNMGLIGAALATSAGIMVGGLIPLIYFCIDNKSPLRLGKTSLYWHSLLKICTNGLSEFVTVISQAVVTTLYNYQMLLFLGENGVAAYGIITYLSFVFAALFLGYAFGSAPITSFHFGAKNHAELHSLFVKNLKIIFCFAILMTLSAEFFAPFLTSFFIQNNNELFRLTVEGFRIYAVSFLFAGFSIFASSFFTALNNGIVSAVISVLRTLVFECICVMVIPAFFGVGGIWAAIIIAEILALSTSIYFFISRQKYYGY